MRILVYKRTHTGDPGSDGVFGSSDCMGSVRSWRFDAVIGVGGIGAEPIRQGISRLVTWVGLGPRKQRSSFPSRGPLVTFDAFKLFDRNGERLDSSSPRLARRLFRGGARVMILRPEDPEHGEALALLRHAFGDDGRTPSAEAALRPEPARIRRCFPKGKAPRQRVCPPSRPRDC